MQRKKTILYGLAALAVSVLSYPSLKLLYYERKAEQLCAIDGGFHVYEVVQLPVHEFTKDGRPFPKYADDLNPGNRLGPDYRGGASSTVLVEGWPRLTRASSSLIRNSDNKVLGEYVRYSVSGGGYLRALVEHSSTHCPAPGDKNFIGYPSKLPNYIFQKVSN